MPPIRPEDISYCDKGDRSVIQITIILYFLVVELIRFNPSKDSILITEISSESGEHFATCKQAVFLIGRFNRTVCFIK
jgi:hypothetical protein